MFQSKDLRELANKLEELENLPLYAEVLYALYSEYCNTETNGKHVLDNVGGDAFGVVQDLANDMLRKKYGGNWRDYIPEEYRDTAPFSTTYEGDEPSAHTLEWFSDEDFGDGGASYYSLCRGGEETIGSVYAAGWDRYQARAWSNVKWEAEVRNTLQEAVADLAKYALSRVAK